jgi:uncharacterized integral membrane protein
MRYLLCLISIDWDTENKMLLKKIKGFLLKLFAKIAREIRYRKRLKEIKKRDPFIYK